MKPTFINIRVLGTTALALLFATSCSDILDEQPRSIYEPTFFQTEKGVEGGITSMYAHLRYIYGQAYYYNSCLTGSNLCPIRRWKLQRCRLIRCGEFDSKQQSFGCTVGNSFL